MNFAHWLVKRVIRKMSSTWTWVYKYRELIMEIWPLAFVLTSLVGALWFIIFNLVVVIGIFKIEPTKEIMWTSAAVPMVFFIYNWLAALYKIYDYERTEIWRRLKEPL